MPSATELPSTRLAWCLALALAVTACASPPAPPPPAPAPLLPAEPPPPPPAPAPSPSDLATRQALAASDRARALPPADLAREQSRLGDGTSGPQATLELAMVLAQSHVPADTLRAIALLETLGKSGAPEAAPWQPVARLLASRLAEQRRLEETIERQNQQLRDQQRRLDQLNDKLEALKAIERNLVTRPGAAGGSPPR